MYRRAVAGFEAALGATHPHTISILRDFATLLDNQGHAEEAEQLRRRAGTHRGSALYSSESTVVYEESDCA